jgi:hypothetical protein
MNHWDSLALDYLIATAKDERLNKTGRVTAERRLFRYVAAMQNPKATKAQIAANAKVIDEAARAAALDAEAVDVQVDPVVKEIES